MKRQFGRRPTRLPLILSLHLLVLAVSGCKPAAPPAPPPTPAATPPTATPPTATPESSATESSSASESAEAPENAADGNKDKSASEQPAESDTAAGLATASEAEQATQKRTPKEALDGTWTSQRLVAHTRGGPRILEFSVSVAGQSLEDVTNAITEKMAEELFADLETPVSWETLLEQPLVQSGWLGNLVADEDQQSQLITMYDEERDDEVAIEELGRFLSRGLARSTPLQISDIGNAPNSDPTVSPFGELDQNDDYTLSQDELDSIDQIVSQFDYNGDAIVSAQEIARNDMPPQNNRMSMSMLDTNTMLVVSPGDDESEISINLKRYAGRIHEHYTFLSGIPREEWFAWTDQRWQALDTNKDQLLVRKEVEKIFDVPPDVKIRVRFPNLDQTDGTTEVWVLDSNDRLLESWTSNDRSTRFELDGLNVKLDLDDAFTGAGPKQLRGQLENALKEPQLAGFFTQQLQLQDDALELVDADGDDKLSDEEFARVWRWLSSRQGARLMNRWMTAQRPWFQMLDVDADNRLSAYEIQQARELLRSLDRDADGTLAPNELPLIARMEIRRTDQRLENRFPLPQQDADESNTPQDWFSAMDTNGDGFISEEEFLGESNDFSELDADSDGFIARSEVY